MYTNSPFRGLGYSGTQNELMVAGTNYRICLDSLAKQAEALYPRVRAQVGEWEKAARAAGVHEANIIAFLGPFNVWEEAITTLSGGTIPREIIRLQNGGAVPTPELFQAGCNFDAPAVKAFAIPPAPVPPSVESMLAAQGGARTGASQYSGPISVTQERPSVVIPEAVQQDAAAGNAPSLVTNATAQYTPAQRAEVLPTVFSPPKPPATPTGGSGYGAEGPNLSLTGGGNGVTLDPKMLAIAGGALFFLFFAGKKRRR